MNTQIKAEELRCGNLFLILHEDSETITKATWEHIRNLQQYEENPDDDRYSRSGPDYAGLPITEELLLKAGFERGKTFDGLLQPTHGGMKADTTSLCVMGFMYTVFLGCLWLR